MAAFLTPLVVFVPPFYAGDMGLGLATVGVIFGLTKLWDIVTDPIAGSLTDRYGPERGRRRFWLLVALPLMMLGTYRIFIPPEQVGWLYFAFWMMVLYLGWTLLTISHIAWGVELSRHYHERARIAAYRQAAALMGAALVVLLPVLSDQFGSGADRGRLASMGMFVLISLPVLMALVLLATPSSTVEQRRAAFLWREAFIVLRQDASLRALLLGNAGTLLGVAATGSALLFYVEHVLALQQWASFAVIPFLFSGLIYLPLLKLLTHRIGKVATWRCVLLFQLVLQPLLLMVPPANLVVTVTTFLVLGAVHGASTFLPLAMLADLKDAESRALVPATGIYVALLQSTSKIAAALAVALVFLLLPLTGFDPAPDTVNEKRSLTGLRVLIVLLPMTCYALAWLSLRSYAADVGRMKAVPLACQ